MYLKKEWLLSTAMAGFFISYPLSAYAKTNSEKELIEILLKRVEDLEARLEKAEQKTAPSTKPLVGKQNTGDFEDMNRKIRTLERKLEVEHEVAETNAKKLPKFEVSDKGFKISSQDEQHQLRIRGSVQADGSFFLDDWHKAVGYSGQSGIPDRFNLKQARLWIEGRLWNYLDFKIMPDLATSSGNAQITDAFIDYHYLTEVSLSAGKQKTPLSLERLQGDTDGNFVERAYPTYLASNRDVGLMLHGEFARPGYKTEYGGPVNFKDLFSYQAGVFNGGGDNSNSNIDVDDDKEYIGRVFSHPFQHSNIAWLEGLGIGVAGSYSYQTEAALLRQTTPIGEVIVDYSKSKVGKLKSSNTVSATSGDGTHTRIYPQMYWFYRNFGLMGEYVVSSTHLLSKEKDKANNDVRYASTQQDNMAWQIQGSWVATGEDNTFQSVKPLQNFNPFENHWGALQLVARYTELHIDTDSFENYGSKKNPYYLLDPTQSVHEANTWGVGANWFLNSNARIMLDYEQTHFRGGAALDKVTHQATDRPTEKVFMSRFQIAF